MLIYDKIKKNSSLHEQKIKTLVGFNSACMHRILNEPIILKLEKKRLKNVIQGMK